MWDRFSAGEMKRRFALPRELMREREVAALVVFGNSGANRANMAKALWLSNALRLHRCYVVVPGDGWQ